jgi:hypothetical protein
MDSLKEILKEYKSRQYKFFNHPQKIDLVNYEVSLREMVSKFSKIKDVSSIYNYTSSGVIGISDLDLFVILNNNFENSGRNDFDIRDLSPRARYLADITIQREDLFEGLFRRYYDRWAAKEKTIYRLWGKELELEEIGEKEANLNKVYYLAGVLFTKMPRDLIRSLTAGRLSIRGLLKIIHTLRFSITLESQITGIDSRQEWLDFVDNFADFRKKWFELGSEKYQKLIDYVVEATVISLQLVDEFSEYVEKNKIILPPTSSKTLCGGFSGYKFYTIFYDKNKMSLSEVLKLNLKLNEEKKLRALLLPSVFMSHMWQLGQAAEGERSKYVRSSLIMSDSVFKEKISPELKKREGLLNQYVDFLISGGIIPINPGDAQGVFGFYKGYTPKEHLMGLVRTLFTWFYKQRIIYQLKQKI